MKIRNRITIWFAAFMLVTTAFPGSLFAVEPDKRATKAFIEEMWRYDTDESLIIRSLKEFVRVPNLSPAFDENWSKTGDTDKALELLLVSAEKLKDMWKKQGIECADIHIRTYGGKDAPLVKANGKRRTPMLTVEFPAFKGYAGEDSILLYGHMDKQPEMLPWSEGLHPREPVLKDGKLYGRGAADDGYALFSAMSALAALRKQNIPHARSIIIIEAEEESDDDDIAYYLNYLKDIFGNVSLVICLDSGAGDYERLWLTNSLRGVIVGALEVKTLSEAVHSGSNSGIAPSPVRIARTLLSRLEDETTGKVKPEFLYAQIPAYIPEEVRRTAAILGDNIYKDIPLLDGVRPMSADAGELVLNKAWRPQLSVTGISGLPDNASASNVIVPEIKMTLSMRIPPLVDAEKAEEAMKALLEQDPPYNAQVVFTPRATLAGWLAPQYAPWLSVAMDDASMAFYGQKSAAMGEGGSIGFMPIFTTAYPKAQILVTGVLGHDAKAHAPDEALRIDMASKVSMCVAHVIAAHAGRGH